MPFLVYCVTVCYQGWQQHSYIPCLVYCVINDIVCYCVLSGFAALRLVLLHTMPPLSCYQCYPVHVLSSVLDLAGKVWETFPACYTAQENEFILPLWRFHQN